MDIETVITHLQIIHTWAEFARERDLQFFTAKHLEDIAQWTDDAMNLLKEQEHKDKMFHALEDDWKRLNGLLKEHETMMQCIKGKCRICPHCANCDVDENGLIKEQEAVDKNTGEWKNGHCSCCGEDVSSMLDTWTNVQNFLFCPNCGAKMEGR